MYPIYHSTIVLRRCILTVVPYYFGSTHFHMVYHSFFYENDNMKKWIVNSFPFQEHVNKVHSF